MLYALAVELADSSREMVYLSKVAQTGCFGIGRTGRWVGKGEQLHDVCVAHPAVGLPRLAFLTIMFAHDLQAQHLCIELL